MRPKTIKVEILRLIRFGLVGVAATSAYVGVAYALVTLAHLGAVTSAVVAHAASSLLSYFGHQSITFEGTASHAQAAPRFAVLAGTTFGANVAATWLLADVAHLPTLAVIVITNIAIIATGYLMGRLWVFAANKAK